MKSKIKGKNGSKDMYLSGIKKRHGKFCMTVLESVKKSFTKNDDGVRMIIYDDGDEYLQTLIFSPEENGHGSYNIKFEYTLYKINVEDESHDNSGVIFYINNFSPFGEGSVQAYENMCLLLRHFQNRAKSSFETDIF